MENKSHALAAGLFVVVISALLALMGLWLTRDRTDYTLYELSTKDSVSGLQPEAAVRYKGVAVGKVTRIGFDPQVPGNVLIRIAVNESAPISPTTVATLGYQGVTGLAHVQLDDADAPIQPPPPGQSGLPRLPLKSSPLSQIAEQGPAILAKVQDATERLNKLLGDENQARFAQALATVPAVAQDARATLQSLRVAGDNASAAASEVRGAVAKLSATGGPLDQIADGAQSLSAAADRFGRVSLPRLNNAADEAARAARRLGRTASGISDNPQSLIYGNGSALPGPGEAGFVAPTRAAPAQ